MLGSATGRGQRGQPGCHRVLGGGPGGSEPSGWEDWDTWRETGRVRMWGQAGSTAPACSFPGSQLIPTFQLLVKVACPPGWPALLFLHTWSSPSFFCPNHLTALSPLPPPLDVGSVLPGWTGLPWAGGAEVSLTLLFPALLQGGQSRGSVTPRPWLRVPGLFSYLGPSLWEPGSLSCTGSGKWGN